MPQHMYSIVIIEATQLLNFLFKVTTFEKHLNTTYTTGCYIIAIQYKIDAKIKTLLNTHYNKLYSLLEGSNSYSAI